MSCSTTKFGLLLFMLCLSGCSIPVFTKPVTVSTKAIPGHTEHGDAKLVKGESCSRLTLLIIPLGFGTSNSAFEDALSKSPGADTLVDWHMKEDAVAIVGSLLYFQSCVTVEGYPVNAAKLVREASDPDAARRHIAHWQGMRQAAVANTPQTEAAAQQATSPSL